VPSSPPAYLALGDDERPELREAIEPSSTVPGPLLQIRSDHAAGHWTLELRGELDVSTAAKLDEEIRRVEPHAETLTIDLRGLAFIDSSGVLAILDANHRQALERRLHIRKGTKQLQSIFRLSGLEEVLPFDG
jgi:anti-anti-sigma factor